jgi:hypothetical protein
MFFASHSVETKVCVSFFGIACEGAVVTPESRATDATSATTLLIFFVDM